MHFQIAIQFVELKHVWRIVVRNSDTKANVLNTHATEFKQCAQAFVKSSRTPSKFIVLARKAFCGYTNTQFRFVLILLKKFDDTVAKITARSENHTFTFCEQNLHDILNIFAYKRLTTSNVNVMEFREFLQEFWFEFLTHLCRVIPNVTHLAPHGATIRCNNCCIHIDSILLIYC